MQHLLNQNKTIVILIHHENTKSLKDFSRQPTSAKKSVWSVNTHCTLKKKSKIFMCMEQREMKMYILKNFSICLFFLSSSKSSNKSNVSPDSFHWKERGFGKKPQSTKTHPCVVKTDTWVTHRVFSQVKDAVCGLFWSLSRVWPCDPMDHSPPGSAVHGILQARILV